MLKNRVQSGFVLPITAILLFIGAIGTLYSAKTSIGQERMSSNLNVKTNSFNAAEAGATTFYDWFQKEVSTNGWPNSTSAKSGWSQFLPNSSSTPLANLGTKGYFWIDPSMSTPEGSNPFWDDASKSVTVYVKGHLVNGGDLLGETTIKATFTSSAGGLLPSVPAGALTIGGIVSGFDAANSNAFQIDGNTLGPAIATDENFAGGAPAIINDIGRTKPGNYTGACSSTPCVEPKDLGKPWNDATALQSLVNSLRNDASVNFFSGDFNKGTWDKNKPLTIVLGDFDFNGTLGEYNGVIVALGGTFNFRGGGNTTINGSVYVAKVEQPSSGPWSFGVASNSISGGGNLKINYLQALGGGGSPGGTGQALVSKWIEYIK